MQRQLPSSSAFCAQSSHTGGRTAVYADMPASAAEASAANRRCRYPYRQLPKRNVRQRVATPASTVGVWAAESARELTNGPVGGEYGRAIPLAVCARVRVDGVLELARSAVGLSTRRRRLEYDRAWGGSSVHAETAGRQAKARRAANHILCSTAVRGLARPNR